MYGYVYLFVDKLGVVVFFKNYLLTTNNVVCLWLESKKQKKLRTAFAYCNAADYIIDGERQGETIFEPCEQKLKVIK